MAAHDPTRGGLTRYLQRVDFGDIKTWDPFLHRLLDLISSEVRRQKGGVGRRLETQDVVQEVLLSMLRYRDAKQPSRTGPFKKLLCTLVSRRIIECVRKLRRYDRVQGNPLDGASGRDTSLGARLDVDVLRAYDRALACMRRAPELALKAEHLDLHLNAGKTVAELAQHFGTTPENVRYHLRTGTDRLLPLLERALDDSTIY
jgi:DNA-directed RNA polymerase specialized sigma24 family protein